MRKENGEIRIIHVVVLIVGIIVGFMAAYFLKEYRDNNTTINNTVAERSENNGSEINNKVEEQETNNNSEANLSDMDFAFMKLENNKKNMIYSPLSIKYGLSMLDEGAAGNTKTEIENLLKDVKLTKYENIENVLTLANGLFIKDTYTNTSEDFKTTLNEKYKAELIIDSFESNENVNKWVENNTFGRIKDLISEDITNDPNLAMILINALAIDMEWEYEMGDVYPSVFTLEDGTEMDNVATMSLKGSYEDVKYLKDDSLLAVELPLKETENGNKFSAILIEPQEKALSEYVENFDNSSFEKILSNLKGLDSLKNGGNVIAPLFKYDYSLNFKADLQKLGINDAFTREANFSKMTADGSEELYVSAAIHKADIDFSNKGITAAAATAFVMSLKSAAPIEREEPEILRFDKPFMYVIKDENNNVWFTGTMYVPEEYDVDKYSAKAEF